MNMRCVAAVVSLCLWLPALPAADTPALILHRAGGEPETLAGFEALPAILGRTAAKVFGIPDLSDTSQLLQEMPSL
jgi:hypothetical protein